jgi:hypothetical protein
MKQLSAFNYDKAIAAKNGEHVVVSFDGKRRECYKILLKFWSYT